MSTDNPKDTAPTGNILSFSDSRDPEAASDSHELLVGSSDGAKSGVSDANLNPAFDAAQKLQDDLAMPLLIETFAAMEVGGYEAAYRTTNSFVEQNSESWFMVWHEHVASAFLSGRFTEAEALCRKRLRQGPGGGQGVTDYVQFLLSAAVAMQGRTELESSIDVGPVLAEMASGRPLQLEEGILKPTTPNQIALACVLVLGMSSLHPTAWFEFALRLDPLCSFAAREVINEYRARGDIASAARVAASMVERLTDDQGRGYFVRCMINLIGIETSGDPAGDRGDDPHTDRIVPMSRTFPK